jgi:2-methylisocitrate lyase-like PEP mutase family enzyme
MEVAERVEQAAAFRRLHDPGRLLILANAWDAVCRLHRSCGASAWVG